MTERSVIRRSHGARRTTLDEKGAERAGGGPQGVARAGQPTDLGTRAEVVVSKVVFSLLTEITIRRLTRADLGITFCRQSQVEHA